MSDISEALWNEAVGPASYVEASEKYQAAVFEQYRLCVEMADRISARRSLMNTFFLTLNTAIAATLVGLSDGLSRASAWALVPGLAILLVVCAAWFIIVRSYRLLNSAKYRVIAAFEERLPAFAYSRAEWALLGEGKDWRKYIPQSHIEQWVPAIFAATYVLAFLIATNQ
jgi:hypothetical protein